MQPSQIESLLLSQREFFESGETIPVKFRLAALKKLQIAIKTREEEILAALRQDLGKANLRDICARWEWHCPSFALC